MVCKNEVIGYSPQSAISVLIIWIPNDDGITVMSTAARNIVAVFIDATVGKMASRNSRIFRFAAEDFYYIFNSFKFGALMRIKIGCSLKLNYDSSA